MNAIKRKLDIYMKKKVKCTIKTPEYAANATGSGRTENQSSHGATGISSETVCIG